MYTWLKHFSVYIMKAPKATELRIVHPREGVTHSIVLYVSLIHGQLLLFFLPFLQVPCNISTSGNFFNILQPFNLQQHFNRAVQRELEVKMFDTSASNSCAHSFGKIGAPKGFDPRA